MKRAGVFLILLFLATARPSDTGQTSQDTAGTGTELVQSCRRYFELLGRTGAGREEAIERGPFGMGYCAGLIRATTALAESLMPDRICLPRTTTGAQAVWAVVQYLEDNPSTLLEQDTELVLRALENAFRCP